MRKCTFFAIEMNFRRTGRQNRISKYLFVNRERLTVVYALDVFDRMHFCREKSKQANWCFFFRSFSDWPDRDQRNMEKLFIVEKERKLHLMFRINILFNFKGQVKPNDAWEINFSSKIPATFVKRDNRPLWQIDTSSISKIIRQRLKQFTIQKAILLQSSEIQDFVVEANNVRLVANNLFDSKDHPLKDCST